MTLAKLRLGILGLGQIGGSIASCLSAVKSRPNVVAFDLRPELRSAALEKHLVNGISEAEADLIESSDIIVISVPALEIMAFMKRHQDALREKTAVTDTGSAKQEITHLADELGLRNFVGGHPLAGTEKRGVESWNGRLFQDANYFLTRANLVESQAVTIVTELVASLGAKAVLVDPQEHDRVFAITSNLPHLIAYSLTQVFRETKTGDVEKDNFCSSSFLGATRVADSDPEMVFQVLWQNRRHLRPGLSALLQRLTSAGDALENNDEERFRHFLGLP